MEKYEHFLEFAKKELQLIGFDQTDIGETILKFLEQSSKLCNNDPVLMKQMSGLIPRLIDHLPLSPITEDDFYNEEYREQDRITCIKKTHRYPHIYQLSDDKFYDDRAVAFKLPESSPGDKIYMYQTEYNSKQEVTLPYYPNEQIVNLPENYSVLKPNDYSIDPEPDYEVE